MGPLAGRSKAVVAIALVAGMLAPAGRAEADASPLLPGFSLVTVISGLAAPTSVQFSPDGRVFVAEKRGVIKVYDDLNDATATVFADLRTQVHNFWDRGMLGMALDPGFPASPYVYVLYTRDAPIGGTAPVWGQPGQDSDPCPTPPGPLTDGCVVSGRLSRLQAAGDVMVGTEQVLIDDWCEQYPSHSVGSLTFGPDGALYVTAGEGASFSQQDYGQFGNPKNPCGDPPTGVGGKQTPPSAEGGALRSQDLVTPDDPMGLGGTLLRIDPATGDALPDNPFAASPDANTRRVVAHGLRNPFRAVVRPGTGELWIGDVGWDASEEVDVVPDPVDATVENFGWPCYEGATRQGGFDVLDLTLCENLYQQPGAVTNPSFQYAHDQGLGAGDPCPTSNGSALSGLAFYGGGSYPGVYDGALFLADYTRKCVWVMLAGPDGRPDPSTVRAFDHPAGGAVELRTGPGGDLFTVDYDLGRIERYQYQSDNQQPIAAIVATPTNGAVPLTVAFDGTGSTDPDGDPLTYAWDLDGDGAFDDSTVPAPSWVYDTVGPVTASLEVTDVEGAQGTASIVIDAGNTAPTAHIDAPAPPTRWAVGDVVAFSGRGRDVDDGSLPASAFHWDLVLHHCPTAGGCHAHTLEGFDGVASGSFAAPDHAYPAYLTLTLTVTDSGGLSDSTSVDLQPLTALLRLVSNVPGVQLGVDGTVGPAPLRITVIQNSTHTVTAPTPQRIAGTRYTFDRWTDGGDRSHSVIVGASGLLLRASYVAGARPLRS